MDRTYLKKDNQKLFSEVHKITPYANDHDEVISEPMLQPQQKIPGTSDAGASWERYISSAKIAWGELTEHELRKSQGDVKKLIGLVQERYAITYGEAEQQVKGFFDTHRF